MSFTYVYRLPFVVLGTVNLVVLLSISAIVQAETKTIVAEAIYSMGDGETPSSAEAMVLQKAKQLALEEAGTYVESYTHVRNLDLTIDEIKTIAGGVMKTEIVEQSRTLEGSGTRFYIKIRALVTTDKIEDLARRKQLGPLTAENKRLQGDVAKLTRNLEDFKRQILQSKTDSEREVILGKIREVEKQFRQVRSTETALYRRLISGEELSAQVEKAFQEEQRRRDVEQRQRERQRESLDRVLTILKSNGHTITIGLPETDVSLDRPDTVALQFVVKVEASEEAKSVIHDLQEAYAGCLPDDAATRIDEVLDRLALVLTVSLKDGREIVSKPQRIHNYKSPRLYDLNQIVRNGPTEANITVRIARNAVSQVASVEGKIEVQAGPVAQPQRASKVRDILRVPDVAQDPVAKISQRSSVSDGLNRELEEELKKIKQFQPAAKLDIPKEVKPNEASLKPCPSKKVKIPVAKTTDTTLRISGTTGSNPYWARVQSIITSQWEPPPVDMAGQAYTVIVKFRLQRDGTIKDVVVQQSSGNAYFDIAGQRAVLRPRVLPAFPADMADSYKEVEVVFRVGESDG